MERGIVKSRVAFVLRSSEIKPLFDRFVTFVTSHFFLRIFLVPFLLSMRFAILFCMDMLHAPTDKQSNLVLNKDTDYSNGLTIIFLPF